MNREGLFVPLEIKKLRSGEVVNFNVYLKSVITAEKKFVLFCRRGEIFNPGSFIRIKLNDIYYVYYQQFEKEQVDKYLSGTVRLTKNRINRETDQNKLSPATAPPRRLANNDVVSNEFYFPLSVKNLQPGIEVNFDVFQRNSIIGNDDGVPHPVFWTQVFIKQLWAVRPGRAMPPWHARG
jgi:hypothetical protein